MKQSKNSRVVRQKKHIVRGILIGTSILLAISLISTGCYFIAKKLYKSASVSMLYKQWDEHNYSEVYDISKQLLDKNPFNNTAMTFKGYSAFFLAVSDVDNTQAQLYLDESINSLRVALISAVTGSVPQIEYMLGKAYFYKNRLSNYYYYSDLAVKYLEMCFEDGYRSDDLSLYLALSYADLGDSEKSIEYFGTALLVWPSDPSALLLYIAEQYCKINLQSAAKQYLFRVFKNSTNDELIIRSRYMLGEILLGEENYDGAREEFEKILEINQNFADAHYGLGLIYEHEGDMAKARYEWKKCLKIQPDHQYANKKNSTK